MSNKIIFLEEEINRIINLYSVQRKSLQTIANNYNVNETVIKRVLLENNIEIRSNKINSSKRVNEYFFDKIDNEYNAYILGFIYADGCVTNNILQLKVSKKDIDILEKIKLALNSEHKIGCYVNNNGYGLGNEYVMLRIKNEKIYNDLLNLGVVPNKTKILTFPSENILPAHLKKHFIRGFFDGDGSIYESYESPTISFTGTYDMLKKIRLEMMEVCNTKANIYPYKNKNVFDYKVGGKHHVEKIYTYFYENANIFLERKKNKFMEVLK